MTRPTRTAAIVLALLALAACGGTETGGSAPDRDDPPPPTEVTAGGSEVDEEEVEEEVDEEEVDEPDVSGDLCERIGDDRLAAVTGRSWQPMQPAPADQAGAEFCVALGADGSTSLTIGTFGRFFSLDELVGELCDRVVAVTVPGADEALYCTIDEPGAEGYSAYFANTGDLTVRLDLLEPGQADPTPDDELVALLELVVAG